jgi:ABC-type lipoprotein release transport system permease subunit
VELPRSRARPLVLLFLAKRSLFASRLTLILGVIAIAVGVGFQIPNTANLAGQTEVLLEVGLTRGAGDIRVEPRTRARFRDGDAIAAQIGALVGARATTPVLVFAGAVGRRGSFTGVPVYGVDRASTHLPFRVTAGTGLLPGDHSGVLVGSAVARRLRLAVGDEVELRVIFSPAEAAITDENVGSYTMTVRGIAAGASGAYRFAYVDRSFLAAEAGEPGAASAVLVHLADHDAAAEGARRIDAAIPDAHALDWRTDDPFLPNMVRANRVINRVSYVMVVAAIAVPVLALLYIHVLKRRREIGILVALGFTRVEVFAIYTLQAAIVALIGIAIGAVLGAAAIAYFDGHPIFEWEGMVVRPVRDLATFAMPALVVLATAVTAGSAAAWRAARTDPARVLQRLD